MPSACEESIARWVPPLKDPGTPVLAIEYSMKRAKGATTAAMSKIIVSDSIPYDRAPVYKQAAPRNSCCSPECLQGSGFPAHSASTKAARSCPRPAWSWSSSLPMGWCSSFPRTDGRAGAAGAAGSRRRAVSGEAAGAEMKASTFADLAMIEVGRARKKRPRYCRVQEHIQAGVR
jgi:hypothetical protein